MANLKTGTLIGGNLIWHQGNLDFDVVDTRIDFRGHKVYTEAHKPTPAEVGAVNKAGDTMSGTLYFRPASDIDNPLRLYASDNASKETIYQSFYDKTGSDCWGYFGWTTHNSSQWNFKNERGDNIGFYTKTPNAYNTLLINDKRIYNEGYKPSWNDVGGDSLWSHSSDNAYILPKKPIIVMESTCNIIRPSNSDSGKISLGRNDSQWKEVWSNNYRGDTIDVTGNSYLRGAVLSNTYNALNNSRLISYTTDKILRIGNTVGQETHTRIHGEGENGHKLSVWQDNEDKWVYHEGHKPTPEEIHAVNERSYVGESYKELGATQDQVGEEYKYRYYLLAEHTGSGNIDCDVEVTIHGDANYNQNCGVHRVKLTRYDGSGDPTGYIHVSNQCTSGNPDSMIIVVKRETGKTRVWIRSASMWGSIYAKKIGSPKGGYPNKLIDGTFLLDGDEQLSSTIRVYSNTTYDADNNTLEYFNVYGKLYDEGTAVSDKYVNSAGDTMTGKLTINGYSNDGINDWNRNIHLSSSMHQSVTGTKCGIGFHDTSSDPKGAIYFWNNCNNGTGGTYLAKINTSGLTIEGDGKLVSNGVDSRSAYNMLASYPSNTLISMPNVPVDGVAYVNWKGGNNILSFTRKHDSSDNSTIVKTHGHLYEMNQRVYSPNNKPSWNDVGGDSLWSHDSDWIRPSKNIIVGSGVTVIKPYVADTGKVDLGRTDSRWREVWSNAYKGGSIDITGSATLRGSSPTIFLVDSDSRGAFLHNNTSCFYVLRSSGTGTTGWDNGPNGRHPMMLQLDTGDATFSRSVKGYYTESNAYSAQYGTLAPFYSDYTTSSTSAYFPMIKQKGTHSSGAEDWVTSIGQIVGSSGVSGTTMQMIKSDGTSRIWEYNTNGVFHSPNGLSHPGGKFTNYNRNDNCSIIGNTYSFIGSPSDTHMMGNAYWDGNWKKFNNANASGIIAIIPTQHDSHPVFLHSDAGQSNAHQHSWRMYHAGYAPVLSSSGRLAAQAGATSSNHNGLKMVEAYNNGYPESYGNVIKMRGASSTGEGELLVGWSGSNGSVSTLQYRSKRDVSSANWSAWSRVYDTNHKPTWADVGGNGYWIKDDSNHLIPQGSNPWIKAATNKGFLPSATNTSHLGLSEWRFQEAWVNNYRGSTVNVTGDINGNDVVANGGDIVLAGSNRQHIHFKNTSNATTAYIYKDPNTDFLSISGSDLRIEKTLQRSGHSTGYFVGSYNNVGENSTKTNPIYTIGSNYKPSDTSLGNMYGIGYCATNAAFIPGALKSGGWGLYVASDGDARVFLDGGNGQIRSTGEHYVNGNRVYHTGYKPSKADVGLSLVQNINFNWAWGTKTPTHIWGAQDSNSQESRVFNGSQIKAFAGLSNVNNWGATSSVSDSSNTKYATAGAAKQAFDKGVEALNKANSAYSLATSNKVYTGTASNYTNFPIGHTLTAWIHAKWQGNYMNNTTGVYLNSAPNSYGVYTTDWYGQYKGTRLVGTWAYRGYISAMSNVNTGLFQRIA